MPPTSPTVWGEVKSLRPEATVADAHWVVAVAAHNRTESSLTSAHCRSQRLPLAVPKLLPICYLGEVRDFEGMA